MSATSQSGGVSGGTGPNGPSPVMVYMSGRYRGKVEPLTDNTVLIARDEHSGVRVGATAESADEVPVRLHRAGDSYELEVMPEQLVWVNAERTQSRLLESGDVLEIGRDGPIRICEFSTVVIACMPMVSSRNVRWRRRSRIVSTWRALIAGML